LKPAQANSSRDPILKNPITKKGLVEWLKVKALSSRTSTKKKKRIRVCLRVWHSKKFSLGPCGVWNLAIYALGNPGKGKLRKCIKS
jgi:hypothetical protein